MSPIPSLPLPAHRSPRVAAEPSAERPPEFRPGEYCGVCQHYTGTGCELFPAWKVNIPAVGTTTKTQLIVSSPAVSIAVCEGAPFLGVFRETYANELRVVLQLRSYVAAVTRHKSGTAVVTGNGYLTTQV